MLSHVHFPSGSTRRPFDSSGSTLILAMITIMVLATMSMSVLVYLGMKGDVANQGARWQQSLSMAEAGVEHAIGALNQEAKLAFNGDPTSTAWIGWVTDKTATVGAKTYTYNELIVSDADTPDRRTVAQVDKLSDKAITGGKQWYRIRSLGTVTLSGASRVSNDFSDVRLRKIGLGVDWASGRLFGVSKAVFSQRQASRIVEAVVEPVSPFQFALFGVRTLEMDHMTVDSYDSADPTRSVPIEGKGNAGKTGQKGNVGTNATKGQAITGSSQNYVFGSGYTNGASMQQWQSRLRWEYRTDAYTPVPSVTKPPFTFADKVIVSGATIDIPPSANSWANAYRVTYDTTMTLSSGTKTSANKLKLNSAGGNYVKIYVKGDMNVESGNNVLSIENGVHTQFYVDGNLALRGDSVELPSKKPGDFVIYGMKGSAVAVPRGVMKKAIPGGARYASFDDTIVAVYAPDHDAGYRINKDDMRGSLVARNITLKGNPLTNWHYDEDLMRDQPCGYRIVSWIEDSWSAKGWYSKPRGRN